MADDDQQQAKKGGLGRKKLLIVAAIVLVAVGGGAYKVLGAKSAKSGPGKPAKAAPAGEILPLDSMTVNLEDGHYLKVGIALQLSKGASAEEMDKESAKAKDAAIALFGDRTLDQLRAPGGRNKAKAQLSKEISELYEGKVLSIYLTEFVTQ